MKLTQGRGRHAVTVEVTRLDEGLTLFVTGGTSHIGSVVLAEPHPSHSKSYNSCTSQVFNRLTHREEGIGRDFAETICKRKNVPVLCVCGIHLDGASAEDIAKIVTNSKTLLRRLEAAL